MDGELDEPRAAEIERAIARDDRLGQAHREMRALDRLLASYETPAPAADLAERTIVRVRRSAPQRPNVIRLARWLIPAAAAAAAILLAVVTGLKDPSEQAPQNLVAPARDAAGPAEPATTAQVLAAADPAAREEIVEEFAISRLDMFQDYEVVSNFDLLMEIEKLEGTGGGT